MMLLDHMNTYPCPIIRQVSDGACPRDFLLEHMFDRFFLVRAIIALHDNMTSDDLLKLYNREKDESVLSCIASNPNCFTRLIEILAKHESEVVRAGAAINPYLERETWLKLCKDSSRMVSEAAYRNPTHGKK